jgi:hypothetical protein
VLGPVAAFSSPLKEVEPWRHCFHHGCAGGSCSDIVEIDTAGTTRTIFDSGDVLGGESCHGNAVRYSMTEDVYVYSDLSNDVLVVGRDGTLQWRLSERVSGGNAAWGGLQHGVHLLDDSILVLANSSEPMTSRNAAFEFALDGTPMRTFTSRSTGNFTADVQRLPSGKTSCGQPCHAAPN